MVGGVSHMSSKKGESTMFQIDEKYLKELGLDGLTGKEKAEEVADLYSAAMEKVISKVEPLVPNLEELFDEAKQELKQEILEFRALGSEGAENLNE
jgi:hypothetical protein